MRLHLNVKIVFNRVVKIKNTFDFSQQVIVSFYNVIEIFYIL